MRGLDKGAELWHLVGMKDKKNIDGMIRYGYVDNESYDSRPNGWRVKGLNEPPAEIERSGEIEIESDRDQRDRENIKQSHREQMRDKETGE